MAPKPMPNGSAEAPIEVTSLPPVVGINFGDSFASIAEGLAECIANEDGERQIACAVSFFGEEMYIGNQASHQLVKNSQNTITGFRNLLGLKFSEIPQSAQSGKSAPVIQHPDIPDEPAYKVNILQPAPAPIPQSNHNSTFNTPLASHVATPRSEPIPATRILTVSEVATMFLASLLESAEDFLGRKVTGAVITVPTSFSPAQKAALEKAATDAGVHVLQLLEEAGAAVATTTSPLWSQTLPADRTQLVVDLGASSLALTLMSLRDGLAHILESSSSPSITADLIDAHLIKFFAADFTKKTKIPLKICPSDSVPDARAEAKLKLAIEHTKRTISASPGAATVSVESLKDGVDYTGSINRMRFDLVVRNVYASVSSSIIDLLTTAGVDAHDIDEIVYVGGSTCLPGLDEHIITTVGFREEVETPFERGTVVGGGVGDPTTVLARGCAVQAALIASIPDDEAHREIREAYEHGAGASNGVQATSRTVGVLLPGGDSSLGGVWVPVVHKETALPARRVVQFDVELGEQSKAVSLEVWEVKETIRIEKVALPKPELDEGEEEEDEEEEEEEIKHREIEKLTLLGVVKFDARLGIKPAGQALWGQKGAPKVQNKGRAKVITSTLEVSFIVDTTGGLKVEVKEVGEPSASGTLTVPAP
ncbi:Hsp70 protein-domain-containing protein [Collybia nuda]|uniref:Hsp70 protein-domain-containing protein n=1 Tax=Collybia nuda TaxID=64659 RepID=A0A9P5Y2F4_9AGAR|nr:Hsp70 protein-domain-containing protein [Collybia nuda]